MIDSSFIPLITKLVDDLVENSYQKIYLDGRGGRLSAEEMEDAIRDYGMTLISLPPDAFSLVDVCKVDDSTEWMLDVPLWTAEEGRSDLTLSVTVDLDHEPHITIDDLHVL